MSARGLVGASAAEAEADFDIAVELLSLHGKRTFAVQLRAVDCGARIAALGAGSAVPEGNLTACCSGMYYFVVAVPLLPASSSRSCSCSIYGRSNRRLLSLALRRS